MVYIRVPIETSAEQLEQDTYDLIRTKAPNWEPSDGNLDVWIIQAITAIAAENRDLASDVMDVIFAYYGSTIMQIPTDNGSSASAATTWTMIDNLGHTIPAGTLVGIPNSAGELISFETMADVVVPAGQVATPAGAVTIIATALGVAGTGLGVAGGAVQLIDILDFVSTVTQVAATSGGDDPETFENYLDRLTEQLRLLSQRPILPNDFAIMARGVPGVYRAVAIDGYNPANNTYNNERMIAIAAQDASGNAVAGAVKTQIDALIQANREINFIAQLMDPNYSLINMTATVVKLQAYTAADVQARVVEAISDYLDPAVWGRDPRFTDATADLTWINITTLYYNEMIAVVDRVEGVDRVTDLTMSVNPAVQGRVDVALASPAALTRPNVITAVVT